MLQRYPLGYPSPDLDCSPTLHKTRFSLDFQFKTHACVFRQKVLLCKLFHTLKVVLWKFCWNNFWRNPASLTWKKTKKRTFCEFCEINSLVAFGGTASSNNVRFTVLRSRSWKKAKLLFFLHKFLPAEIVSLLHAWFCSKWGQWHTVECRRRLMWRRPSIEEEVKRKSQKKVCYF